MQKFIRFPSRIAKGVLLADQATNAFPQLAAINLLLTLMPSANAPTHNANAGGLIVNGVLTLAGVLGDGSLISQTAPVSKDGNVPF